MFERFTDRARRVIVLAQEEARLLNHGYIGTEHLLLGVVHEGAGVGVTALESLGISLDGLRAQVERMIGEGERPPSGHIPFTRRTKTVLEQANREALQLGHSQIGTEHLVLGMLREGDGVAGQVLDKCGARLDQLRDAVLRTRSEQGAEVVTRAEPAPATPDLGEPNGDPWKSIATRMSQIESTLYDITKRLDTLEQRMEIDRG